MMSIHILFKLIIIIIPVGITCLATYGGAMKVSIGTEGSKTFLLNKLNFLQLGFHLYCFHNCKECLVITDLCTKIFNTMNRL